MRAGMDETTGRVVTGWDHVSMIIRRVLTTRPGSLVLRRKIGSGLKALQDETMVPETVLRAYVAIATALSPADPHWGEPGFRLRKMHLVTLDAFGAAGFILSGDYYPKGHLGDASQVEIRSLQLPVRVVS
jgi:phage baseplate assembly protein W